MEHSDYCATPSTAELWKVAYFSPILLTQLGSTRKLKLPKEL
jgi:hypothetical protein